MENISLNSSPLYPIEKNVSPSINEVPPEILKIIFSNTAMKDRSAIRLTNKKWHKLNAKEILAVMYDVKSLINLIDDQHINHKLENLYTKLNQPIKFLEKPEDIIRSLQQQKDELIEILSCLSPLAIKNLNMEEKKLFKGMLTFNDIEIKALLESIKQMKVVKHLDHKEVLLVLDLIEGLYKKHQEEQAIKLLNLLIDPSIIQSPDYLNSITSIILNNLYSIIRKNFSISDLSDLINMEYKEVIQSLIELIKERLTFLNQFLESNKLKWSLMSLLISFPLDFWQYAYDPRIEEVFPLLRQETVNLLEHYEIPLTYWPAQQLLALYQF